ncbi:MAG: hypothetical protein H0X64_00220 [Gemmatimonadaceae bacterium]|nr:hypothetical protein [Gemmatimonadaceae bacterium]
MESTDGPVVQVRVTTLRIITGSLPELVDDTDITISGIVWRVRLFAPVDDGLETEIMVAR